MKIAFYGSSLLSAYWNGAATYYRGMLPNLAAMGHEIRFYEPDAFDRQQHRDIDPPDWARSEEHTSELQSLMRISYAVFCLKKKNNNHNIPQAKYHRHRPILIQKCQTL